MTIRKPIFHIEYHAKECKMQNMNNNYASTLECIVKKYKSICALQKKIGDISESVEFLGRHDSTEK